MGAVVVAEQMIMNHQFGINDVGVRWGHYCNAVEEVKSVVQAGDFKFLPSRLMQIFDKYATRKALGDDFHPLVGQQTFFTGTYDLAFISEVLSEALPYIGAGSFSEVYKLSDDWVIKVNCRSTLWSPQDAGFGWLKTCTQHQCNPFIPKLMALEQNSHLFIAVVETLQRGVGLDFTDGSLGDLAYQSYEPDFDVMFYLADPLVHTSFRSFISMNPEKAVEVARIFEEHRDSVRGNDDILDNDNIMHRNGFPVLNDPICDAQSAYIYLDESDSFSWMCKN